MNNEDIWISGSFTPVCIDNLTITSSGLQFTTNSSKHILYKSPSTRIHGSLSPNPPMIRQTITPNGLNQREYTGKRSNSPEFFLQQSRRINIVQFIKANEGSKAALCADRLELVGRSAIRSGKYKPKRGKESNYAYPTQKNNLLKPLDTEELMETRMKHKSAQAIDSTRNASRHLTPLKIARSTSHKLMPDRSRSSAAQQAHLINKVPNFVMKHEAKCVQTISVKIPTVENQSISISGWDNDSHLE